MVGNAVPPRLAYYLALSIKHCFSAILASSSPCNLVLVGYVKSDLDFDIIRHERIYYIRGGNRPGAMQYGQLTKPIKWLLLHRKDKIELYELLPRKVESCKKDYLSHLGFKPNGDDYWLFRINSVVTDNRLMPIILKQVGSLKTYPQLFVIENKKK